jgi:uncharacterized membrane protein YeiH
VTPSAQFQLPIFFDVGATFIWAITGAAMGVRRGYDYTGIFVMAFVSALGGGLLRDGIFLQHGPPVAVRGPMYLVTVLVGAVAGGAIGVWAGGRKPTLLWRTLSNSVDALGLGAYACVGAQMSLEMGLGAPSAVFIGVVNGVGGGLLRDVLTNAIWMLPGQLLAIAALLGAIVFVALQELTSVSATNSAWIAVALTFVIRMLAVRYNWRTRALRPPPT